MHLRIPALCAITAAACAMTAVPASAQEANGGQAFGEGNPALTQTVAAPRAKLMASGVAAAPEGAPQEVKDAISAANEIVGLPYRYGGGHKSFQDTAFDCSGTISHALGGAELLDSPLDSSSFASWGSGGRGQWITVYTNPGHAYAVIAGLRLDTSAADDPSGAKGPRWRQLRKSNSGYRLRHPAGL